MRAVSEATAAEDIRMGGDGGRGEESLASSLIGNREGRVRPAGVSGRREVADGLGGG